MKIKKHTKEERKLFFAALTAISVLLLVFSSVFAIAEEIANESTNENTETQVANEISEENNIINENATESQIECMYSGKGAEIRLLQLEKAVTRNILKAKEVISELKAANKDTSVLEGILATMEKLKEDIKSVDPKSEDAVKTFVELKEDAISLSKNFRDEARKMISLEDANRIRENLKNREFKEVTELENKIKERKREFNAERLGRLFEKLGISRPEVIEQVKNGEMKWQNAWRIAIQAFKDMPKEQRKQVYSQMKEEGMKRNINARDAISKLRLNQKERSEKRIQERFENTEKTRPEFSGKLQQIRENNQRKNNTTVEQEIKGSSGSKNNKNRKNNI